MLITTLTEDDHVRHNSSNHFTADILSDLVTSSQWLWNSISCQSGSRYVKTCLYT